MKKVLQRAMLITASCLVLVACNKDDDDEGGTTKTKTQKLTGDWKMTDMTADPPWDQFFNWDSIPNCEKDDIFTFESNGNGTYDEGATKCDPTDPQTETFSWTWMNNETELQIIDASDTINLINVVINSGTMTASQDVGLGINAHFTFKKQ